MSLYFAYGSNLWIDQMKDRCPDHEVEGRAVLRDFKWFIYSRGYANVVPAKSDFVEGTLYSISASDEARLDKNEGVANGLYRKEYHPVDLNGRLYEALVYIDPRTEPGEIKAGYAAKINRGLVDAKLSEAYITKYIRPFVPTD